MSRVLGGIRVRFAAVCSFAIGGSKRNVCPVDMGEMLVNQKSLRIYLGRRSGLPELAKNTLLYKPK